MIIPVMPSRGVIFEETLQSLLRNGIDLNSLITVSGLPIPDAHNYVVREALKLAPSQILMLEDDMVMPDGALDNMIKMDKAVVAVDYPVINSYPTIAEENGIITHCGLGCTLIKAGVFKAIGDPWFKTDKSINYDTKEVMDIPMKYGGHDIWFGREAREHGFEIHKVVGFEAEHLRCEELTRSENNNGTYNIYKLPKIKE